jgi:hypothetical protein
MPAATRRIFSAIHCSEGRRFYTANENLCCLIFLFLRGDEIDLPIDNYLLYEAVIKLERKEVSTKRGVCSSIEKHFADCEVVEQIALNQGS